MLLTQGGQRKQDFKGRVQLVAHVAQAQDGAPSTLSFPDATAPAGAVDFRFYQKVEGRFTVPEGEHPEKRRRTCCCASGGTG